MNFKSILTLPWILATTALSSSIRYFTHEGQQLSHVDIIKKGTVIYDNDFYFARQEDSSQIDGYDTSDYTKYICAGPVVTNPDICKLVEKSLGNMNLAPIFQALALSHIEFPWRRANLVLVKKDVFINDRRVGGYSFLNRATVSIKSSEYNVFNTIAHELTHVIDEDLNYRVEVQKEAQAKNILREILSYHEKNIPQEAAISTLADSVLLGSIHYRNRNDREVIKEFHDLKWYKESKYRLELVARLSGIVAQYGILPPHLIDNLKPLIEYFKSELTPKIQDYIDNHRLKENLLPSRYDRLHPETILSYSGEDLLIKKFELSSQGEVELSAKEQELKLHMQTMEQNILNRDFNNDAFRQMDIQDERVKRYALTLSIKNNRLDLFEEILNYIEAPEYLGPQLVLASELKNNQIAIKLAEGITNQYYLAKATEISLGNDNPELLSMVVKRVYDPWFLERSRNDFPDNTILKNNRPFSGGAAKALNNLDEETRKLGIEIIRINPRFYWKEPEEKLDYMMNLSEKNRDIAQKIIDDLPGHDGPHYFIEDHVKNLDYLVNLEKEDRELALVVLKHKAFESFVWNERNNLEYIVNLTKEERDRAENLLTSSYIGLSELKEKIEVQDIQGNSGKWSTKIREERADFRGDLGR